jgi:hypothetical protein
VRVAYVIDGDISYMKFASRFLCLTLSIAASAFPTRAAILFTFDADNAGTSTQFTDTLGGVSAKFTSPADPGGFVVEPTIFQALSGEVLGDPGPADQVNIPLTVTFNTELTAISLVFATSEVGTVTPLLLTAYQGGRPVGSASAIGVVPNGFFFPEGELAYAGSEFNSVVISTAAMGFAIDNLAVAPAPEPGSLLLMGLGLCTVAFLMKKTFSGEKK